MNSLHASINDFQISSHLFELKHQKKLVDLKFNFSILNDSVKQIFNVRFNFSHKKKKLLINSQQESENFL